MNSTGSTIDADVRSEVIEGVLTKLREHYIVPDVAQQMTALAELEGPTGAE